ncbi:MAG: hypothetical protein HOE14_08835 [Gemmatimonadales bacterium]|jgi:hypothetical protein|nr:hypothetical protein [Gemmatimonadales bacterium]
MSTNNQDYTSWHSNTLVDRIDELNHYAGHIGALSDDQIDEWDAIEEELDSRGLAVLAFAIGRSGDRGWQCFPRTQSRS